MVETSDATSAAPAPILVVPVSHGKKNGLLMFADSSGVGECVFFTANAGFVSVAWGFTACAAFNNDATLVEGFLSIFKESVDTTFVSTTIPNLGTPARSSL